MRRFCEVYLAEDFDFMLALQHLLDRERIGNRRAVGAVGTGDSDLLAADQDCSTRRRGDDLEASRDFGEAELLGDRCGFCERYIARKRFVSGALDADAVGFRLGVLQIEGRIALVFIVNVDTRALRD